MKKLHTLVVALAGVATLGAQADAGRVRVPARRIPTIPKIPTFPLPTDDCKTTLDESRTYSKNVNDSSAPISNMWNAGVSSSIGMKADCNELEAYGSAALTSHLILLDLKPAEVRLTASTNKDKRNSIDYSMYLFGFEVAKDNIANSTRTLKKTVGKGYVVPTDSLLGTWTGSLDVPYVGEVTGSIDYEVAGSAGTLMTYEVNPTKVRARLSAWGKASTHRTGKLSRGSTSVSVAANMQLFQAWIDGGAQLAQTDASAWKATADLFVDFWDVLSGKIRADLGFRTVTLYEGPNEWFRPDPYHYEKPFTKPF